MKNFTTGLSCLCVWLFSASLFAQSPLEDPAQQAALEKKFYAFQAKTSPVTLDIAYYAFAACLNDCDKVINVLKSWPKPKTEALSRLLSKGFQGTKYGNIFEALIANRALEYVDARVADLAGLREYTQVMTGQIGEVIPEEWGSAMQGNSIYFYPDGHAKPLSLFFSVLTTIGYRDGDYEGCANVPWRIYLTPLGGPGKVEYLGQCKG